MYKNTLHLAFFILGFLLSGNNNLFAQSKAKADTGFIIHGTIEGMDSGMASLIYVAPDKKTTDFTAKIHSGKFQFQGSVPEPGLAVFTVEDLGPGTHFFIENSEITLHLDSKKPDSLVVKGSKSNDVHLKLFEDWNRYFTQGRMIDSALKNTPDTSKAAIEALNLKMTNATKKFAADLKHSISGTSGDYVVLGMLSFILFEPIATTNDKMTGENLKAVADVLSAIDAKVKKGVGGTLITKQYEFKKSLLIGQPAPELTLKKLDGQNISLSQYKGKYVLLNFWTSYCVPCRSETPALVKVHKQFGPEKLEIISASFDQDSTKWQAAIQEDSMTWTNATTPLGWGVALESPYELGGSIPYNFLIDKNGIIVARNLYEKDIFKKLEHFLGKE